MSFEFINMRCAISKHKFARSLVTQSEEHAFDFSFELEKVCPGDVLIESALSYKLECDNLEEVESS